LSVFRLIFVENVIKHCTPKAIIEAQPTVQDTMLDFQAAIDLKNKKIQVMEKALSKANSDMKKIEDNHQNQIELKNLQIEDLKKANSKAMEKIKLLESELKDQKMLGEVNQDSNVKVNQDLNIVYEKLRKKLSSKVNSDAENKNLLNLRRYRRKIYATVVLD